MTVNWWRLGLCFGGFLGVMIAAVLVVPIVDRPWSGVLALWLIAAAVVLLVMVPRVKRKPAAQATPDPWAPVIEAIHELSTDELISTWNQAVPYINAGTSVQLANVTLTAVEEELTARGIPLCTCGAPKPGGVHTLTCQES
jgi:uncharacterized membrane protein YoaK (UPF0700 family)